MRKQKILTLHQKFWGKTVLEQRVRFLELIFEIWVLTQVVRLAIYLWS